MKKALLLLLSAAALTACAPRHTITGHIEGLTNDTVLIESWTIANFRKNVRRDTVTTSDGRLAIDIPIEKPICITISPAQLMITDHGERYCLFPAHMRFFLCKGERVTFEAKIDSDVLNYRLEGTPLCEDLNALKAKVNPLYVEMLRLQDKIAMKARPEQLLLYEEHEKIRNRLTAIKTDYIRAHPDRALAGYCLSQIPIDSVHRYYEIADEAARNSIFRPLFESALRESEKRVLCRLAKARIKAGAEAPDFTLERADGGTFALSSLRGKYVVLDFWGSWCGWCIKGFPEMKKVYARHKGRLEIVGIACNDTPEKWLAAISEHALPWINVFNPAGARPTEDIAVGYAVDGFPTKIIIDPEGRIVDSYTGEVPAFYEKLTEILK